MRTKIFIALVATAIVMSSCGWLFGKSDKAAAFNIEGNWKLDSLTAGKDTSSLTPLLVAWGATDSSNKLSLQFHFKQDTLIATYASGEKDTTFYQLDVAAKQLAVTNETTTEVLRYSTAADSTLSIAFKDSTTLYLSRK
jgi:hypothetical protein